MTRERKASEGFVLWFTGLPCSGKTTLARLVAEGLERRKPRVEVLDGDFVRKELSKGLGFDKRSRDENIRRIGFVCRLLSKHGVAVIVAAVSPYRAVREELRGTLPNFIEIYVKASLQTCISRDIKGLYKKALAGNIRNFTGVDDPYEPPVCPEMTIETDHESPHVSALRVLVKINELRLIRDVEEPKYVPGREAVRIQPLGSRHQVKIRASLEKGGVWGGLELEE